MAEIKSISLPAKTKAILEKKLANRASLQALLQAENQSIDELIEVARDILDVPADWTIQSTEQGFVVPANQPADVVAEAEPI